MSHQQDWQYRKLKDGLCRQCGKHRLVSDTRCEICLASMRFNITAQRLKARAFRRVASKKVPVLELSVG